MPVKGNKDAKGRGFDGNPQNINRKGRPRKLVSGVLKEMRDKGITPVSQDEIKDIYLSLVNNTEGEMQELLKDKEQPMLTKLVIQAMLKGKGIDVLEKMFDRAIGKAEEKVTNKVKIEEKATQEEKDIIKKFLNATDKKDSTDT